MSVRLIFGIAVMVTALSCSEAEEPQLQPTEAECRQHDGDTATCHDNRWCTAKGVTVYEVTEMECMVEERFEACLRLTAPRVDGMVEFPEVVWGMDSDGTIMSIGTNAEFADIIACDERCDVCRGL